GRFLHHRTGFHEPQVRRTPGHQVPVGGREQRSPELRVKACRLHNEIRPGFGGLTGDAGVQRVLPAHVDPGTDTAGREAVCARLERAPVRREQTPPCALERRRIEWAGCGQVLVVVADEELECRSRALCQPDTALECRLMLRSGVENDENVGWTWGHRKRNERTEMPHCPVSASSAPTR